MGIGTRCASVLRGEVVETSYQTMGVSGTRGQSEGFRGDAAHYPGRAPGPGELEGKSCRHAGLARKDMR